MNQEKMQKVMEALGKANIHIAGDFVIEKHVGTEVANVETGGIVNIANAEDLPKASSCEQKPTTKLESIPQEELFRFIHPSIPEEEEWEIHQMVKRLVSRNGIQEICQYLKELKREKKILLPQSPSIAYVELTRMGMPTKEGFNEKTFFKYYMK